MILENYPPRPLKAIVLAAGDRSGANRLNILELLGEKTVINYVLETVGRFVHPEDVYVVVKQQSESVQANLLAAYRYVIQPEIRGTGHAVYQTAVDLKDFQGDILIMYADTPLFRPDSILGMLNRHRLKRVDLTLFTATSSQALPYGRIIRDMEGRIVDIIEDSSASEDVRTIRELNVGAYVARAETLFPALEKLAAQAADKMTAIPLTDIVHQLVREGKQVTSFQSYDPDEILGINTPENLEQAEFILQKRYFRPARREEENEIRFGTGGWRAVIGEGFTMRNVRRLCQALANQVIRMGEEPQGVLIGYDRRFLSERAAEVAAEVFAGNNIPVVLLPEDVPTPLVTYATELHGASLGLVFTASHNPPEWNGLKVFHSDGSLLMTAETNAIEKEVNGLLAVDVAKIELDLALEAGIVKSQDFSNAYIDAVEALIDMRAIRAAALRLVIDPMYGVGQATLGTVLTEARCRVTTIRGRRDPLFGGRSPAPDLRALGLLITTIKDGNYDLGLAMDGDADRIAIVDERGEYIHINDVLLLLYYYLHKERDLKGGVVRNLATTHLLDRLAAHFGEKAIETPVGFKHIIAGMQANDALLGGESSGGLTIRGHILGKDGILASALMVEMLARTGMRLSTYLDQIYAITGRLFTCEENIPATSEMKIIIPKKLEETPIAGIESYPVIHTSYADGTKFFLENDNWLLLRFSGTEPVLRIFAEADTPEKARLFVAWGKNISSQ